MSRLCSSVIIEESAVPYLTWMLRSKVKSLSETALSTLHILNVINIETSFLVMCHDGVPTLIDMIILNSSTKAKELYLTCRKSVGASLSLLRLRDTRAYVVFTQRSVLCFW